MPTGERHIKTAPFVVHGMFMVNFEPVNPLLIQNAREYGTKDLGIVSKFRV